jgi:hypothetical protein
LYFFHFFIYAESVARIKTGHFLSILFDYFFNTNK